MTIGRAGLPRVSRWLLSWAAARLRTPDLPEDAADLFADIRQAQGALAARRWYRHQARAAVGRALWGRTGQPRTPRQHTALAGLRLDTKLALRMLVRYPGLTLVGGAAIAFAIFVGAGLFEFINLTLPSRDLPLPHGERVVGLRYWDLETSEPVPLDAGTLRTWQRELRSVAHIGGYQTVMRNLIVDRENHGPVEVAVMSPSGFQAAGVLPLIGRALADRDSAPGAPPAAVVSERVWRAAFGGNPGALGQTLQVGDIHASLVGVMPRDFGFPLHHEVWMPLVLDEGTGPMVGVRAFGRVSPDATIEQAQAEAEALTPRIDRPAASRDRRVTTQVLSYRESLFDRPVSLLMRAIILQLNIFAALFLLLVAANVALLMFARAAAREREFVVRTALGASRGRIAKQLFVEALALSSVATAVGLAATGPGLHWLAREMTAMGGGTPPFWYVPRVSPATALYAGILAVLAAVVAGVVPALKATGRNVTARLGQAGPGGGGLRFGGIWTAITVTQIATTVVFSAGASLMVRQAWRTAAVDAPFPAAEYLSMRVELDRDIATAPYPVILREFEQRIADDPMVAGVTIASGLPVLPHPTRLVETQTIAAGDGRSGRAPTSVETSAVDQHFFRTFRAPLIAGREFNASDGNDRAGTVIVDRYFVEHVLNGRNAVGERVRWIDSRGQAEPGPWLEIVGVVEDVEGGRSHASFLDEPPRALIYQPLSTDEARSAPLFMAVHMRSGGEALRDRVRQIAAGVSPGLRVHDIRTLDQVADGEAAFWRLWADLILMVSGVALFLSLAGIYAATSFAVSRRTREIGIRVALGAPASRIAFGIVSRPMAQVATGVSAGALLMTGMHWMTGNSVAAIDLFGLLCLSSGVLGICGLACVGPMLRALRVQPTDALGAEQ